MAERATVFQRVQIGKESTAGTAVPATNYLQSFDIKPDIKLETKEFRPIGQKADALVVLGKEWSEASVQGPLTFSEVVYCLAGMINDTTPTLLATGAYQWNFTPRIFAPNTIATYTVEHGTPGFPAYGDRFSFGTFTAFDCTLDRSAANFKSKMIGQQTETNFALTQSGVTSVDLQPVLPTQISVYLDTTWTAPGADAGVAFTGTKLTRVVSVAFSIDNVAGPLWVLNSADTSWTGTVELSPKLSGKIKMEADAAAMDPTTGLLAVVRSGATRFLTIQAIGPVIGGGKNYGLVIQAPIKLSNITPYEDYEGVYAVEWDWNMVFDPTFFVLGASPTPTAANSATGGTVAAGLYDVVQTALTSGGESLPSVAPATTTTTGSTSKLTLTPAVQNGAQSYNLYYKLSTDTHYQVVNSTGGAVDVTSYAAGTADPPAADSSGGGAYFLSVNNKIASL